MTHAARPREFISWVIPCKLYKGSRQINRLNALILDISEKRNGIPTHLLIDDMERSARKQRSEDLLVADIEAVGSILKHVFMKRYGGMLMLIKDKVDKVSMLQNDAFGVARSP